MDNYPWAYGYLRSAVDGAIEILANCRSKMECEAYDRLRQATERIEEELTRHDTHSEVK